MVFWKTFEMNFRFSFDIMNDFLYSILGIELIMQAQYITQVRGSYVL